MKQLGQYVDVDVDNFILGEQLIGNGTTTVRGINFNGVSVMQ